MKLRINKTPLTVTSFGIILLQIMVATYIIATGNTALYFIALVNALALFSIYFVLVLSNKCLTNKEKLLWIVAILVIHVLFIPVYWYCFIRDNQQFKDSFWIVK